MHDARSHHPGRAAAALWAGLALALALVLAPRAGAAPDPARARLDPRLGALTASGEPVAVWVTFADKGEQGPGDLAARLARAEAEMAPRNRARRERAGLRPLVGYDDLPVHAPYLDALRARGLAPYGVSRWGNEAAVRVPGTRLAELARLPGVARLRPVERARVVWREPAGPDRAAAASGAGRAGTAGAQLAYGQTAGMLGQVNLPAVHDSGYVGTGVLVCVLDNGFNRHDTHVALAALDVPPGHRRDFIEGDSVVTDTVSVPSWFRHGTWTLGCMAGNLPGTYIGAAPGATYALGRTEFDGGESSAELVWWRMGAEWADSLGADIISSSLGYNVMDDPLESITWPMLDGRTSIVSRAAQTAAARGILVVNSAGNDGGKGFPRDKIAAPADVDGDSLLAVGAVDAAGLRAAFSSIGPTFDGRVKPDLMARGVSNPLISANTSVGYTSANGTSFACPIVAGLAACLMQARPDWPAVTVLRALRRTASRAGAPDTLYGHGLPDGLATLRWIPDTADVPPPAVPGRFVALALAGPNPVVPGGPPARVVFALGAGAPDLTPVRVSVVDATGRAVRTLASATPRAGDWYPVTWDGRDADGRAVRPGIYLVVAEAAGRTSAVRVAWLR
jgi:subtilisin family serine protease